LAVTGLLRARFVVQAAPVPDSATVSGLPAALDATVREPLAAPAAVGSKVTVTVHDPLARIEAPQVLVWANGPLTASCDTDAAPECQNFAETLSELSRAAREPALIPTLVDRGGHPAGCRMPAPVG
jgi:hypothetical protein